MSEDSSTSSKFDFYRAINDIAGIEQQLFNEFSSVSGNYCITDALEFIDNAVKAIYKLIPQKEKNKRNKEMNSATKQKIKELLDYLIRFTGEDHMRIIGDKLADCNAVPFLVHYIEVLTSFGISYPEIGTGEYQCYRYSSALYMNLSDGSVKFCQQLCKSNIVHLMLETLKYFQKNTNHESRDYITEAAMTILHNCAEADENYEIMEYFNDEPDMVTVIAWYSKNTMQEENKDLVLLSAITLAQIVEDDDNDVILADGTVIQTILQLLEEALEEPDHRAEGYSAKELMSGIARLANNDSNSAIIMQNGILKHLRYMLTKGDDLEKATAAEAIWVLAFLRQNRKKILAEKKIIIALKEIGSDKDKSQRLDQAVNGAMWMLTQQLENTQDTAEKNEKNAEDITKKRDVEEVSKLAKEPKGHIMISYQWDYQQLLVKLKQRLEADGYKVWIDLEEMGGSTLEAMAKAVENAEAVLFSFCRKYKNSRNCRTEAEYAFRRNIPMIPLKVENNYEPDGWLGIIIGTKLYFDFADSKISDKVYSKLTKEIGHKGKTDRSKSITVVDASASALNASVATLNAPATVSTSKIDTPKPEQTELATSRWTCSDVKLWANQNGLRKLKTKKLNGEILLFLRKMRQEAPDFFYRCASGNLGLKEVGELMMFTKALSELK